jgi:hypothetical protein
MQRVARLRLPDAVTAVAAFNDSLLLVATKTVLALYQLQQERLVKVAYCFTRAPVVSLSPAPSSIAASKAGAGASSLGLVLASDMLMGVIAFEVMEMAVGARLAGMGFCRLPFIPASFSSKATGPEPAKAEFVACRAGVEALFDVAGVLPAAHVAGPSQGIARITCKVGWCCCASGTARWSRLCAVTMTTACVAVCR